MDTTGTSVPQCPPFLCFLYCFVQKLADRNGFLLLSCLKRFTAVIPEIEGRKYNPLLCGLSYSLSYDRHIQTPNLFQ